MTAILSRPVVECSEARGTQFDVVETIQWHAHRGINHLGAHPVEVLVFYARGGIPYTGGCGIKSFLIVFRQILRFDSRPKERCHRHRIDLLAYEILAGLAIEVVNRMRRAIPELLIDSL